MALSVLVARSCRSLGVGSTGGFLICQQFAICKTDYVVIVKNIWYDISRGDVMETITIIIILIANTVISFFIAGWVCSLHIRQIMDYYYTDKMQNEKRLLALEQFIADKMP
mgnify:CR=1 FL=1